ncbi:MAG: hypothetical protein M1819_001491 [Sarea resinae]|nr:MAG: hypothetical protein M1819_001491 [Sarea resinae]
MASIHSAHGLRIAVEGCGHGTLNAIYSSIRKSCEVNSWNGVDLLIIGGDFQAVRNAYDLNCMSVPFKFREIGDFHEYYSGVRTAPYLTIFVGGNHEASNHLWELYYGGWVAPNIYYLGAANVVRLGPLRIGGLSGIWKGYNYNKPHHERLPYNQTSVKSIYHVRELDVRKLLQIRTQVDVGVSHDWPRGIEWDGDWKTLFRKKDLFEADSRAGTLGSAAARYVLDRLRPPYWFSAHLHVKFSAIVEHKKDETTSNGELKKDCPIETARTVSNTDEINLEDDGEHTESALAPGPAVPIRNEEEIEIDLDDEESNDGQVGSTKHEDDPKSENTPPVSNPATRLPDTPAVAQELRDQLPASFTRAPPPIPQRLPPPADITNKTTRFLALDKCLPNRKFLQILDVEPATHPASSEQTISDTKPYRLEYDKEWLAITRVFADELCLGDDSAMVPRDRGEAFYRPLIEREEAWIEENVVQQGKMTIPDDFELTAPVYDAAAGLRAMESPVEYTNPQTARFCDLVGIENRFHATDEERERRMRAGPKPDQPRSGGGGRGRGGGFGHGRGRGGFRGGRGRGRGRGRG